MSKPRKTLFMEAVAYDLGQITSIREVKRGKDIPTDFETVPTPFAAFFSDAVTKTPNNQIQSDKFNLVIHVLIKEGTVSIEDQGDDLDALIEHQLLKDGTAIVIGDIIPVDSDVFYIDDVRGILQATYEVTLSHIYGDATTI